MTTHAFKPGDRVVRIKDYGGGSAPNGSIGTVVKPPDHATDSSTFVYVSFDHMPTVRWGCYPDSIELLGSQKGQRMLTLTQPITQAAPIPTHCHRCNSRNEYDAPANYGNLFRCGQCRSYFPIA